MLLNSLYTYKRIFHEDKSNKLSVQIRLNPSHEIFKGHFPGNPILPGVCIVQIMKEILESQSENKLILNFTSSIKYLSFIKPDVNRMINIDLELKEIINGTILCSALLYCESVVFCRFKGEFKLIKG